MSRNVFSIFNSIKLKWSNYFLIGPPMHFSYSYFSQKNKNIEVSDKYTFDSNGYTNFMIVDTQNNHYKVGNNLWFWKWDSIEDWHSIKKDTRLPIWYYGYRVPFLGFFPNIICLNKGLIVSNNENALTSNNSLTTFFCASK